MTHIVVDHEDEEEPRKPDPHWLLTNWRQQILWLTIIISAFQKLGKHFPVSDSLHSFDRQGHLFYSYFDMMPILLYFIFPIYLILHRIFKKFSFVHIIDVTFLFVTIILLILSYTFALNLLHISVLYKPLEIHLSPDLQAFIMSGFAFIIYNGTFYFYTKITNSTSSALKKTMALFLALIISFFIFLAFSSWTSITVGFLFGWDWGEGARTLWVFLLYLQSLFTFSLFIWYFLQNYRLVYSEKSLTPF